MDARAWGGLVRALRRTVGREAGTAEELVNLWQFSDHDPNKSEYKGIEKIVFKKHADIPATQFYCFQAPSILDAKANIRVSLASGRSGAHDRANHYLQPDTSS